MKIIDEFYLIDPVNDYFIENYRNFMQLYFFIDCIYLLMNQIQMILFNYY
jgi:hypothetical protein